MATDVNPTKATADAMWRRTRGGWAVSWKSDSVVKRVKPFPEIHLPAVSWFCHQVSSEWKKWDRQEGREEDKSHYQNPPSCWHLWQDKTEDADKEVQSVAPCASGWRWRCSAKNSLTASKLEMSRSSIPSNNNREPYLIQGELAVSQRGQGDLMGAHQTEVAGAAGVERQRGSGCKAKRRDRKSISGLLPTSTEGLLWACLSPTIHTGTTDMTLTCQTVTGSLLY